MGGGAVRAVTFALHINEHWPLPASRLSFLNSDAVHWCKPVFDFFSSPFPSLTAYSSI